MKLKYSIASVLIAFLLASCGGGGGGSSGSGSGMTEQSFDSTTQPVLTANISKSLANVNEKINITWNSVNADKCKIPEISEDEYGPNGDLLLNIISGGLYVYNLECYNSSGLRKLCITIRSVCLV